MLRSTIARTPLFAAAVLSVSFALESCGGGNSGSHLPGITTLPEPPPRVFEYNVGPDYHAYSGDFAHAVFLPAYNDPSVRSTVLTQLQGMADRGATVISTRIWFAKDANNNASAPSWWSTFPMSAQEHANLRAFAQDVASVQSAKGTRLRLNIGFFWLGVANYQVGSPSTGLGDSAITASDYTARVAATTASVLSAVGDVQRPDGVKVVDSIYLDLIQIEGTRNQDWFLANTYPQFVSAVLQAGFHPTLCFLVEDTQDNILNGNYIDSSYPILNGHRSVRGMYRSIKFLADRRLYIPARIDFAYYVHAMSAPYLPTLTRVLDDADATLPSLGAPRSYGIAETYYFMDSTIRHEFGQAFAAEASKNSRLHLVTFWTVPNGDPNGGSPAYPFAFEDYLMQ